MLKKLALVALTAVATEVVRRMAERLVDQAAQRRNTDHHTTHKEAVQRWEDEGGAVVTPALPVPTKSAQAQANVPDEHAERTRETGGRLTRAGRAPFSTAH